MADLPYMPFYVDDFEGATPHLTLEEDGAYNRLLRLCWRQADCMIPADPTWIRRMLRIDQQTFDKIVAPLLAEFFTEQRGRYFQKRQRDEFLKAKATYEARRAAGRAGGKSKARKQKENPDSGANNVPEANDKQTDSEALASRTRTRTISPPNGGDDAARHREVFKHVEATLFAVEGVKGSNLEFAPLTEIVKLVTEGFDLESQVIPILRGDLARATPQTLRRMSWTPIANKVREHGERSAKAAAERTSLPMQPVDWGYRLDMARKYRMWDQKWGPFPNQPGCLAPAALVQPGDGKGWSAYDPEKGLESNKGAA